VVTTSPSLVLSLLPLLCYLSSPSCVPLSRIISSLCSLPLASHSRLVLHAVVSLFFSFHPSTKLSKPLNSSVGPFVLPPPPPKKKYPTPPHPTPSLFPPPPADSYKGPNQIQLFQQDNWTRWETRKSRQITSCWGPAGRERVGEDRRMKEERVGG
jgi:hypothetical protein